MPCRNCLCSNLCRGLTLAPTGSGSFVLPPCFLVGQLDLPALRCRASRVVQGAAADDLAVGAAAGVDERDGHLKRAVVGSGPAEAIDANAQEPIALAPGRRHSVARNLGLEVGG